MTIKKIFRALSCIAFAILFFSCGNNGKYKITGEAPLLLSDNDMVYLRDYDSGIILDSTAVMDGRFELNGKTSGSSICALEAGALFTNFILEKGTINIDLSGQFGATGTKLNMQMTEYLDKIMQLAQSTEKGYEEITAGDLGEDEKELQLFTVQENFLMEIDNINNTYFSANKNNALGLFVLTLWMDFLTPDRFLAIYDSAGDYIQNNQAIKEIMEAVIQAGNIIGIGDLFIDCTIEKGSLEEEDIILSDYIGKGKYVLLDFWASWCGPCIAEIPNFKEINNRFSGEKFEIISIAVGDSREAALEAIKEYNLSWRQIIDQGSFPIESYGIEGIPETMIFDPNGILIHRGLRGEELISVLEKLI